MYSALALVCSVFATTQSFLKLTWKSHEGPTLQFSIQQPLNRISECPVAHYSLWECLTTLFSYTGYKVTNENMMIDWKLRGTHRDLSQKLSRHILAGAEENHEPVMIAGLDPDFNPRRPEYYVRVRTTPPSYVMWLYL